VVTDFYDKLLNGNGDIVEPNLNVPQEVRDTASSTLYAQFYYKGNAIKKILTDSGEDNVSVIVDRLLVQYGEPVKKKEKKIKKSKNE